MLVKSTNNLYEPKFQGCPAIHIFRGLRKIWLKINLLLIINRLRFLDYIINYVANFSYIVDIVLFYIITSLMNSYQGKYFAYTDN